MKLKIYSADGASSREQDFPIPHFEDEKGLFALRQVILALQANRRQGTVSTKTRSTVNGTGKKPFKQKGLGRARQGSLVGPQMPGGAIAHGPQPRDWRQKVNTKMRRLALQRALFDRAVAGEIAVIERFDLSQPKTKEINGVLSKIAPTGRLLIVDDSWADGTKLAARNLARVEMAEATQLNPLDLADHHLILVSEKGLQKVLARAGQES